MPPKLRFKADEVEAETAGNWSLAEDLAADFVCGRLHGAQQFYVRGCTDAALDESARRIHGWPDGGAAGRSEDVGR